MDPLSDVLLLLKLRSYWAAGFDAGGAWSLQFPRHEGNKCFALVSGQCWLSVDGVPDPVQVEAGDCLLLPSGRCFRFATDLAINPVAADKTFLTPGGISSWNGGGDCFGFAGHLELTGANAGTLLGMLPPIVQLKKACDKTALRWSLEQLMQELREPQPGGFLVAQQLASVMLVKALRLYLAEGLKGGVGWLFALADRQMAAAINAMHNDPAHRWTVQSLAERAGMSRTIFTLRFKKTVGASPMEYLTRWRMLLAEHRLTSSDDPISAIALSLGYESESAFSKAFRRVMSCSPRQRRRGQGSASPSYRNGKATRDSPLAPITV